MKMKSIFFIFLGALLLSCSYGVFFLLAIFIQQMGYTQSTTGLILGIMGVGTMVGVVFSQFVLGRMKGNWVAAIGCLFYAIGITLFLIYFNSQILVIMLAAFFLGIGWGIYYNAAPYSLSLFANNDNRSILFSYLSAFNVLGSGIAPTLGHLIWKGPINYNDMFLLAGITSILAAVCFYFAKMDFCEPQKNKKFWKSFPSILKSFACYPLIMVCLGACAFTIMVNFQSTYANSIGMNYAYFYIIYSLSVVLSRFTFGKWIAQYNQYKVLISLLTLMVISLISFMFLASEVFYYCLNSALFGVSYGLAYPTLQSIAVNVTPPKHQANTITAFSFSYFIGVYAFPAIAGLFITNFGYNSIMTIISAFALAELLLAIKLYYSWKYKVEGNL